MHKLPQCDPNHIAFMLAIENKEFNKVNEILANDSENRYVRPVGFFQVTALQMAAWYGNIDLLNRLYEKDAERERRINSVDKYGRCALYYAAHNGKTDATKWLLEHGGLVDIRVGINLCTSLKLPLPVCWGRTPLHQAVKNNHADVVRVLVESGANVNAKDEHLITPLLLAGSEMHRDDPNEMIKFVEIIRILVAAKVSVDTVHPDTGTTALHHAAMLGSADATKILLANGASPTNKCKSSGSTPLHIAASTGSIETLKVLLEVMQYHNIDTPDEINRTALHRASYQGHRECVRALISHGANLVAVTKTGVTVVDTMFAHILQPSAFLTDILDSCVQMSNNSALEKNITVDFSILAPRRQRQMAVVTAIIAAATNMRQLEILQHPLVETFLTLKWARLRLFFFLLILIHLIFVISFSVYAIMFVYSCENRIVIASILASCSCILLFHNMILILLKHKLYLRQFETWLSLICATLSLMLIMNEFVTCSYIKIIPQYYIQLIIHIVILLSWVLMLFLIAAVPRWGHLPYMFFTMLRNILKVLLMFSYLIIGFAIHFTIIFHGNKEFNNVWKAIVKMMVMMMGEYEYKDLFENESDFILNINRFMFLFFILLASIVLLNLMIGLAVNDIPGLKKTGHTSWLWEQAEFVAHFERVTSHRIFRSNWLHPRLRTLLHSRRDIPTEITLATRENYFHNNSHFMKSPNKIPADLIESLFLLAIKNNNLVDRGIEIADAKLVSILSNLEKQIREWKTYCCRNLVN